MKVRIYPIIFTQCCIISVSFVLFYAKLRRDFIAMIIIGFLVIVWDFALIYIANPFYRGLLRERQVGVAGAATPFPPNQLPGQFIPENVGSNSFHSNRMTPQQSAHYGGQYGFDQEGSKTPRPNLGVTI